MSNYPDNIQAPSYDLHEMYCQECDNITRVKFVSECGMSDPVDDDDTKCPRCLNEMEEL